MDPRRESLMNLLGGLFCSQCNIEDIRILQIDHIFGNGRDMPLSKAGIMDYYLENLDIACEELQILCCNCHRIKSLENGDIGRPRITL